MLRLPRSTGRCADTQTSMEIASAWIPPVPPAMPGSTGLSPAGPFRNRTEPCCSRYRCVTRASTSAGSHERARAGLPSGAGASYDRCDCYNRVAEARADPSVCWRVWPLVDLDPPSLGYSALSCRCRTRARYHTGIALADALLIRTFARMGFDIDVDVKSTSRRRFSRCTARR